MPPPGGIAGIAGLGSGFSATIASVVIRRPAIDAASCSACRTTLVGSMMPAGELALLRVVAVGRLLALKELADDDRAVGPRVLGDHHPEIIEEGNRLGWEWLGHNQTNALRLTGMDPAEERAAIRATIDRIEAASGTRPVGWLGAGLAETWNTLDYLAEADICYVCDWVYDDPPYGFEIGTPPLVSLPYSVQTNDVPAYFEMKVSVPEFEAMLKRQFDTLYREGETVPRVMAIAVHPFVTGQPHRIGALDAALEYICSHAGVWRSTGLEIVQHYLSQQS
jgi:peptidoglycan/xylan/chitin deacetylase (PgdA/CDA1 family)